MPGNWTCCKKKFGCCDIGQVSVPRGAVRPADAAPAVVLEEEDAGRAGGADLAVAARGHRHPLQGRPAHGAVAGSGGLDVDGMVATPSVFLAHHGRSIDR